MVADVLWENQLPGHGLTVEIIESAMMEPPDEMIERVYEIRMMEETDGGRLRPRFSRSV
ncbi:hypothetical protein [Trabulsiella guamensis]|uniref:hypothetical protein n=1 Tax=Trabulsiella guamensis TaxID=158852 RepID=UPI000A8E324E|nr:hypothetical protein [Trabulsiella guamensis]